MRTAGAESDATVNPLKSQYFFAYGVMGSLIPFLPIYLKQNQALREGEIGLALGVASVSILFTPILMTLLADTRFDPRRLAALIFTISGLSLLVLFFSHGFWMVLLLLCLHSLAYAGVMPLHDGMTFSIQRQTEQQGREITPYHRIRVWGTIGFIVPSLILFVLLDAGWSTAIILICGVAFSLFSLLNVFRLPDPRLALLAGPAEERLPTTLALTLLLRPHMRVFCAAMFVFSMGAFSFGSFYPLYLVEIVGVKPQWVGLIFNFGVAIEIIFMLSLGWLQARLGLRRIMILGAACFFFQTLAIGFFPNVWIALLSQGVHGMIILAWFISPVVYLNRQAGDRFRNSIQGLYTMAILGLARIVGIVAAGQVAQINLRLIPFIAAALAFLTLILFVFSFRDNEPSAADEAT